MRHIIPISGKDSLAVALLLRAHNPDTQYEYVFNSTGWDLPETLEWIKNVENEFGKINIVGDNLTAIVEGNNFFLPNRNARYCTRQGKIEPFEKFIGKDPATVYFGIRADEADRMGYNNSGRTNIIPVYPLKEMGATLSMVYAIVTKSGLKPPTFYWKSLHDEVTKSLGYDPKETLKEWVFDMLFAWRSRSNCDRCFNQRLYEWVGLSEHHPDLFWEAETFEYAGSDYTWNGRKSLEEIFDSRDSIKKKRVNAVVSAIRKASQLSLFESDNEEDFIDILSVTSCGLFCGK